MPLQKCEDFICGKIRECINTNTLPMKTRLQWLKIIKYKLHFSMFALITDFPLISISYPTIVA